MSLILQDRKITFFAHPPNAFLLLDVNLATFGQIFVQPIYFSSFFATFDGKKIRYGAKKCNFCFPSFL